MFFIFVGNEDNHDVSNEFEIRPDLITDLAALERLEKSPYIYNWRNIVATLGAFIFDSIFLILAGNKEMYKCLNIFEFRQDPNTDYGFICP